MFSSQRAHRPASRALLPNIGGQSRCIPHRRTLEAGVGELPRSDNADEKRRPNTRHSFILRERRKLNIQEEKWGAVGEADAKTDVAGTACDVSDLVRVEA